MNTVLESSFLNIYYFAPCNLKAAQQTQNLSEVTVPRTHSQNANNAAAVIMRTEVTAQATEAGGTFIVLPLSHCY